MSNNPFRQATKARAKLRLALIGPSGSGKTYTALTLAQRLAGNGTVAVLDTERGSASLYADLFKFDVLELASFHPQQYIDGITAAAEAGYAVVVIDSLSHAWMGKGGALELVSDAEKRQTTRNSYTAWRDVTPLHNALVDALISAPIHVIATMRAKTEYVQEKDDRGKTVIRKVGLQPVQRDGLEYEFTVVADMDTDNTLIVSKSRIPQIAGQVIRKPDARLADTLLTWLDSGTEPAPAPKASSAGSASEPSPSAAPQRTALATTPSSASAEAMPQHVVIESLVAGVNGEKRDLDGFIGYVEQRSLTIGDACRRLGIPNTPRGLREALREIGLDGLKDRLDASIEADAQQPALDGMPAVERERPESAVGSH